MLCDRCRKREATIHDVTIVNGEVREAHVCETCAEEIQSSEPKSATLGEWLAGLGMMTADAPKFPAPPRAKPVACPTCGLKFLDLKKTGLMGCQVCYETFETRLGQLLKRAHDGGASHKGKTPSLRSSREVVRMTPREDGQTAVDPETLEERVETLTHQLALAIEAENYEKAARIRDELAELTGDGPGGMGGIAGDGAGGGS